MTAPGAPIRSRATFVADRFPLSFLDRIRACATRDLSRYRSFRAGATEVGLVHADFAPHLAGLPGAFAVGDDWVALADGLETAAARTAAVAEALASLRARGLVPAWRDEAYAVGTGFGGPVLFTMERAAVPLFGVRGYGVHLNGYVRDAKGQLSMWIGRRSLTKPTAPGKLDQMVAGGQPAGVTLFDNLVKECAEEAGMPAALARQAAPVGTVSYCVERAEGLRRDTLFNFDLELPADFTPVNADGEIADFHLWPIEDVIASVRESDDFKFNCALVVIDFLVRHGLIEADHPDYEAIVAGLHG